MAALAYRDDKILARILLLRPFFCLTRRSHSSAPTAVRLRHRVEWQSRMAALFAATQRACP